MDKLDKELIIIFEESEIQPKLDFLKENLKHHKIFKKLIKLCIQFKIKLYELLEDRYIVRNLEKIIKKKHLKKINSNTTNQDLLLRTTLKDLWENLNFLI